MGAIAVGAIIVGAIIDIREEKILNTPYSIIFLLGEWCLCSIVLVSVCTSCCGSAATYSSTVTCDLYSD